MGAPAHGHLTSPARPRPPPAGTRLPAPLFSRCSPLARHRKWPRERARPLAAAVAGMSATCAVSRKAQPLPPRPPGERDPPAKAMRRGQRRSHEEEREQLPWPRESAGGGGGEPEGEQAASLSDERRRRQPQEPRALAASAAAAGAAAEEERLEREHFRRIINAFRYYG